MIYFIFWNDLNHDLNQLFKSNDLNQTTLIVNILFMPQEWFIVI